MAKNHVIPKEDTNMSDQAVKKSENVIAKGVEGAAQKSSKIDFNVVKQVTDQDLLALGQRSGGGGGLSINIVCSENNGKRVRLSNTLHGALGSPKGLQAAQNGKNLGGVSESMMISNITEIDIVGSHPKRLKVIDKFF